MKSEWIQLARLYVRWQNEPRPTVTEVIQDTFAKYVAHDGHVF